MIKILVGPNCPQCKLLKLKLAKLPDIEYKVTFVDITTPDGMTEVRYYDIASTSIPLLINTITEETVVGVAEIIRYMEVMG